jgi:hypothetical protein
MIIIVFTKMHFYQLSTSLILITYILLYDQNYYLQKQDGC